MITSIFKYREWSKVETFTGLFLLAIFISEMAVIFLLGQEAGEVLSKAFASQSTAGVSALGHFCKSVNKIMGFWIFPFLIMTGVSIWSTVNLVKCWRVQDWNDAAINHHKILGIIQNVSPLIGMLGTVVSLYLAMGSMKPNAPQNELLISMLSKSSIALITTACGFALCIVAYLIREIFKEFLIRPKEEEH